MNYTEERCPVCGEQFAETDDIAVCPICGTPHHRECYLEQKHCSNEDKHSEDFEWRPTYESFLERVEHAPSRVEELNKVYCPYCGSENAPEEPVCTNCGARLYNNAQASQENPYQTPAGDYQTFGANVVQIQPNDIISGHTVADTAEYVQRNADKYIPKFFRMERTGRKLSFNWAAFLFGPYWFFYRKLPVIGFVIMIASLVVSALCTTPDITAAYNEYYNALTGFMQGSAAITQEQLGDMAMKIQMMPESIIDSSFTVLVHIFCGLFANVLYKNKAVKDISWAKEAAASPEQYRVMLFKKGGVSLAMLLLSLFGFYCAQQIVAMFLNGGL